MIGLLGYFVSWQFGSCYSWIARKGDITGMTAGWAPLYFAQKLRNIKKKGQKCYLHSFFFAKLQVY